MSEAIRAQVELGRQEAREMGLAEAGDEEEDGTRTLQQIITRAIADERASDYRRRKQNLKSRSARGGAPQRTAAALPAPGSAQGRADGDSLAVQVQVVNGQIMVDESNLVVEASGPVEEYRRATGEELVNRGTYQARDQGVKWTEQETQLFYMALEQFGTDFSLIAKLFPGRSRPQIKRKYLKEVRSNKARVSAAMEAAALSTEEVSGGGVHGRLTSITVGAVACTTRCGPSLLAW